MSKPVNFRCVIGLSVALAGCVSSHAALAPVESAVQSRVGVKVSLSARDAGDTHRSERRARAQKLLQAPLNADAAVELALLNHPQVAAALAELAVTAAERSAASLPPNPELDAELGFAKGEPTDIGLAVSESVSGWLSLSKQLRAASLRRDAAQARTTAQILGLAHSTRLAFLDHQAAIDAEERVMRVRAAAEAALEVAKRLHEAGNINDLAFAQESALAEEARLASLEAKAQVLTTRQLLATWIGVRDEDTAWSVIGPLAALPEREPDYAALEIEARHNSLALLQLQALRDARHRDADVALTHGYLGELRAGVQATRDAGEWDVGPTVGFQLPIFDHGQGGAAVANADATRYLRLHELTTARIEAAARTLLLRIQTARERVVFYRDTLLPLRKQIVDETLLHYNAMQVGVFELIAARRAEIEVSRGYVAALRSYWQLREAIAQLQAGGEPDAAQGDISSDATGSSSMTNTAPSGAGGH